MYWTKIGLLDNQSLTRFSRIVTSAEKPEAVMSNPSSSRSKRPQEQPVTVPVTKTRATDYIIDVDSFELSEKETNHQILRCQGYTLCFPAGKSPYTAYPFALHDTRALPWDISIENGIMTLFAQTCSGSLSGTEKTCQSCLDLLRNGTLEGIRTRLVEGVHQNAQFPYHSFGGLHEIIRHKTMQVEFYRL